MNKGMKIIEFRAENFKRLKVVEFKPEGAVQIIGGENAQGKTSVMDAIFSALAGATASKQITKPIREGESRAEVRLDMGDIVVTRTWKDGKSELKVESPLGASFNSPQKMLDELLGRLSFDPLDFTRLDAKKQVSALMDIAGLSGILDKIADDRLKLYESRTEIGRTVKALQGSLDGYGQAEPDIEAVSVADLVNEYAETKALEDAKAKADADLVRIQSQINALLDEQASITAGVKNSRMPLASSDKIREAIDNAEEINQQAERNKTRKDIESQLLRAIDEYRIHDVHIEELDSEKVKILAESDLPIEGLGFTEEGVTYNGVSFAQCSSSEQIRVSLAMAMALNPTVKVIRILDGSLLDKDSMGMVSEMAQENGFQVWIERVGDADGIGVIIEDGEVKE